MSNYYGSICLSDIDKSLIVESNGKKYLNISVVEKKEAGKFGDSHFISISCKKEDRKDGIKYIIGNLKPSGDSQNTKSPETPEAPKQKFDPLPF